ncbi:stage II sporulation protein D [Paenibacillus timonensis]|uniref:Stage II sporulation protein D n=1 Tax=Paenibacillus timonensis TaxID=225915 RepID=A0ABW3SHU1_9BACL|nr:stage II sporulation protein D [Paenibacillus timonensis]MCH1642098.1 stage II sporulation protein D [Paenibacillus timonensis]
MQERSQVKINVAPRREAKRGKEESGNRETSERAALRSSEPNEGKAATVSAPANVVVVRQKPEQAVSQERGREGAGRTVIGVEVGGTAKEKTEKPVNSGFERTAAQRTELAERTVRVERTADVNTRVVRTAMEGARRSEPTATRGDGGVVPPGLAPLAAPPAGVPPETRVRVRVRTRPGRAAPRKSGGRWLGGTGAAPVAAALIALALLLPALIAWRAAQAPAARHDPAATAQTQAPAAVPPSAEPRPQDAARAEAPPAVPEAAGGTPVRVYLTRTGEVESVPLEQYVTGVLAAEMPADFELAALKAQAIAARTFIVRRLTAGDTGGTDGGKADVNDTVEHQVYLSREDLEEWPSRGKGAQLEKLRQAVRQTEGIVMTYRGQPITASFFSSSGGYTENSEDYWSLKIPYLRSVPSPWDAAINPKNRETIEMPLSQLYSKLGQKVPGPVKTALAALDQGNGKAAAAKLSAGKLFKTLSWTDGRRVKEIRIGEQVYTGREVREKLNLRSSQFTLAVTGDTVKITTYGYGHGVGMSQWGANGMAKEWYTATQILKHYYTGISFQQASHFIK